MRRAFLVSVRMAAATVVMVGIVYPLAVWGISAVLFPHQAAGSLITRGGPVVGSELIGQTFTSPRHFHSRPSSAGSGNDAMSSSASNLGPTNRVLISAVASRVAQLAREDGAKPGAVPVDLVTSSGSGLDPDISPDSAYLQVRRVARARRLSERTVRAVVAAHVTHRQLGFLGEERVNVLELNLALDALSSK